MQQHPCLLYCPQGWAGLQLPLGRAEEALAGHLGLGSPWFLSQPWSSQGMLCWGGSVQGLFIGWVSEAGTSSASFSRAPRAGTFPSHWSQQGWKSSGSERADPWDQQEPSCAPTAPNPSLTLTHPSSQWPFPASAPPPPPCPCPVTPVTAAVSCS